jgi:ribosome-associated heat shock protein Hsp15
MRLDKWLWAARFFKTRALSKQKIEQGKIRIDGVSPKVSRDIKVGDVLVISQPHRQVRVECLALTSKRGSAIEAASLFKTLEVQTVVEASNPVMPKPKGRPPKKDRRHLRALKRC